MKLQFQVQPYYLLAHSLKRAWDDQPFPEWVELAERTKKQAPLLFGDIPQSFIGIKDADTFRHLFQEMQNITQAVMETPEFRRLLDETRQYCQWVEGEWLQKKEQAAQLFKEIAGLAFPDMSIMVLITHPKLWNGMNILEKKIICWGHSEDWENYTVVYLCHEILHLLADKSGADGEVMHALIELAIDNELRVRLNHRGQYFKEQGREVGHPDLRRLEKKLFQIWKGYLAGESPAKDLVQLGIKNSPFGE